jgi:hypothetical protein
MHSRQLARPLGALTDSELRQYRRELERCLRDIGDAPVRGLIERKLATVLAEHEARDGL